jgi:hypothetical protein
VKTVIAVYRFWRCTGLFTLENLGLASINPPYYGLRDYWFPRKPQRNHMCIFPTVNTDSNGQYYVNLTHGAIYHDPTWPAIAINSSGLTNLTFLELQYTWTDVRRYKSYEALKADVFSEFKKEYAELLASKLAMSTDRVAMDPYIFDLYWATKLIEEFGMDLERLIWLTYGLDSNNNKVYK